MCGHSSASLPKPRAAGPDTAGHKDLQTMFMTVGLLLGLAKKDILYTHNTHTYTHTKAGPKWMQRLHLDVSAITLEDPERVRDRE